MSEKKISPKRVIVVGSDVWQFVAKIFKSDTPTQPIETNIDWKIVADRSGSMYSEMERLLKLQPTFLDKMKVGDTLTYYLFDSSFVSLFGALPFYISNIGNPLPDILPSKEMKMSETDKSDQRKQIYSKMEKEFTARGCTNMTSPFRDINISKNIENTKTFYDNGSPRITVVILLTDGGNNTGGSNADVKREFIKVIDTCKSFNIPTISYTVGFGDWADERFLIDLAENKDVNGTYLYVDSAEEYMESIVRINDENRSEVFEIEAGQLGTASFVVKGDELVPDVIKLNKSEINIPTANFGIVTFGSSETGESIPSPILYNKKKDEVTTLDEEALKYTYIAAALSLRNGNVANAIKIVNSIGDVNLTQIVFASRGSSQGVSKAYNALMMAANDVTQRYVDGYEAFDLTKEFMTIPDFAEKLGEEKGLKVKYPENYKTIGVKHEYQNKREDGTDFPILEIEDSEWTTVSVKSTEGKTTILMTYNFPGKIPIEVRDRIKFGFDEKESAFTARSTALVDGNGRGKIFDDKGRFGIFIKNFSEDFFKNVLIANRLLPKNTKYSFNREYFINLGKLPMFKFSETQLKTEDYGALDIIQTNQKARQTVLNYLEEKYVPQESTLKYGKEAAAYLLERYRITDKGNMSVAKIPLKHIEVLEALKILGAKIVTENNITWIDLSGNPEYKDSYPVKSGSPKNFIDLTQENLEMLLFIFGVLDILESPIFKSDVKIGKGAFNTIPSVNGIIEMIIYNKTFGPALLEQKLRFKNFTEADVKSINESLTVKLTEDQIRETKIAPQSSVDKTKDLFKTYGIKASDFTIDEIIANKSYADFLFAVTNPSQKVIIDVIKEYVTLTSKMKLSEKIRWIQDELAKIKSAIKTLNQKLLELRLSYNGFADQDPVEPVAVPITINGINYDYKPKVVNEITYNGDVRNIVSKAKAIAGIQ